jgi:sec-independent protein translocase protein TatB
MFDIGFGELVIVAILGLLVLGPERLPIAIKHISLWVGRFKRGYRQVRAEVEREIGADEIRRQLHNEEVMQSLNATKDEMDRLKDDFSITPPSLSDSKEKPDSQ